MSDSAASAAQRCSTASRRPRVPAARFPDAATREVIGRAPVATVDDLDDAIARATAAQRAGRRSGHEKPARCSSPRPTRSTPTPKALAHLLSREQGKPLNGPNARFELGACSAWLRTNATTVLESQVLVDDDTMHAELVYKAAGVVGAIGPWNWPLMITIWQIGPSLRMGNTVVAKPSEYTPFERARDDRGDERGAAGRRADRRLRRPRGGCSTVVAPRHRQDHVHRLDRHRPPHHRELRRQPGPSHPRARRQRCGDRAAGHGRRRHRGGSVLGRVHQHGSDLRGDEASVRARLASTKTSSMHWRRSPVPCRWANGLDEGNVLGPLQNRPQFDIVSRLVDDAKSRGARIVTGGEAAPELGELFYRPHHRRRHRQRCGAGAGGAVRPRGFP